MPHQLRRIIGINLRNPKSDLPSGRVAELDPRGGIVAAGQNGVGKTTFLRLLPLFYGATPTQILRGTGLSSLVRHTLPDASSAVAYEYERQSEEDLRCVVMHARPDLDAPQFHIIKGGFEERFFADEEGEFVRREDFKARVEAMGLQVDRRLHLHEWRAVILNERLPTKEGAELHRLAAVHSLGPTSLHGLDQIAASMANERLSFRDLQGIVLDKVMDAQGDDGPRQTTRELKQSRDAVTSWLEAREHLVRLRERRGDAAKLREQCQAIKATHHKLSALHAAVKDLLQKTVADKIQAQAQEVSLQNSLARERQERGERIRDLEGVRNTARIAFEEVDEMVVSVERRLKAFQKLNVEAMAIEQDGEADLQAQRQEAEREQADLSEAAQGIQRTHDSRVRQIEAAFSADSSRISSETAAQARALTEQLEGLRQAESDALEGLKPPERLAQLAPERETASNEVAALKFEAKRPSASAETLLALAAADERVRVGRREKDEADKASKAAAEAASAALDAQQAALERWKRAQAATGELRQAAEDLEQQLVPPKGSLFEFLRSQPTQLWAGAARVIDERLLKRSDLAPAIDAASPASGSLAVGPLQLDVRRVETPGWVELAEVRERLVAAKAVLAQAETQEAEAKRDAERLQRLAESAANDASRASAHAGMAAQAVERADSEAEKLRREAAAEALARGEQLKGLIEAAAARVNELDEEDRTLRAQAAQARERVMADFRGQRERAKEGHKGVADRLGSELAGAKSRREQALQNAAEDQRRELAGAGVDPTRVQDLTDRLITLGKRLLAISANRHHVDAWRKFVPEELSALTLNRERRSLAEIAWAQAKQRHQAAIADLEAMELRVADDLLAVQSTISRLGIEEGKLQGLLDQGLGVFAGPAAKLSREWIADELIAAVTDARSQIYQITEEVNNLRRTLRNLMTSVPGSVDDWVQQAEKQALQSEHMLAHEEACDKALLLCQWFESGYSQPVIALNNELRSYLDLAGNFVRSLEGFDRRIGAFNRELQAALQNIAHFERFRDLSVTIKSTVNQIGYLQTLREMQAQADSKVPLMRGSTVSLLRDFELPDDEVVGLIRGFREMLQRDGGVHVNLADQVKLECSLVIDTKHVVITNEDEFRARASNGNTALIMAMFLLGFAAMVRRKSPVRLTWISDEIGRYDASNLAAFLHTLDSNQIDVISATPSADPAAIFLFKRRCIFEDSGAIRTHQHRAEVAHVAH